MFPLGAVTLSVIVGDYPQHITKDVTFLVVDCSSARLLTMPFSDDQLSIHGRL